MNLPSITIDELLTEIERSSDLSRDDDGHMSREELQDLTGKTKDQLRTIFYKANKEKRLSVKTVYRERLVPGKLIPMPGYKILPKGTSLRKKKSVD